MHKIRLLHGGKVFIAYIPIVTPIITWNSMTFLAETIERGVYREVKHFALPFGEAKLQESGVFTS
jgi:hypothetical protein